MRGGQVTDRLIDRFYFGGVRPRAAANKSFKPSFKADRCTDKADGHTDAPTQTHTHNNFNLKKANHYATRNTCVSRRGQLTLVHM